MTQNMTQPFRFANGQLAYDVQSLIELCEKYPLDGYSYLTREDLEKWLEYIGKRDFAQIAKTARQASVSEEERLKQFLKDSRKHLGTYSNSESKSNPIAGLFKAIGNLFSRN